MRPEVQGCRLAVSNIATENGNLGGNLNVSSLV